MKDKTDEGILELLVKISCFIFVDDIIIVAASRIKRRISKSKAKKNKYREVDGIMVVTAKQSKNNGYVKLEDRQLQQITNRQ